MSSKCNQNSCSCGSSSALTIPLPVAETSINSGEGVTTRYRIENMDCPTEEALIRNKLKNFPGVTGLEFNLLQRTLTISHTLPSLEQVEEALKSIGMEVGTSESMDELPEVEKTNWWPLIV